MKILRPRSLNGLILVGFGLVAAPLLVAIIWALINLDRLAAQSEELVETGVTAAEQNLSGNTWQGTPAAVIGPVGD